jgi:GGDEF domain-containing protein
VPLAVIMAGLWIISKDQRTSHGHKAKAGDLVLQSIGNILTHSVRSDDIACRYGGEEFVIVLVQSQPGHCQTNGGIHPSSHWQYACGLSGRNIAGDRISGGGAVPEHGNSSESLLAAQMQHVPGKSQWTQLRVSAACASPEDADFS